MADLNVTLVEDTKHQKEVPDNTREVKKEPELIVENEKFPCDKCACAKLQARNLHMIKIHNIKTIKYTPLPAKRKVGHPPKRFICDVCNVKLTTETEFKSHMMIKHATNMKSSRSEKKQVPVERVL